MKKKEPVLKIENGVPVIVNEAELFRLLDETTKNEEYLERNYSELLKLYPDKWVVILGERVTVVAETLQAAIEELDERGLERGICALKHLNPNPPMLVV